MATLVQTPTVRAGQITQLRAIDRPQGTSGAGAVLELLQTIAPQVQKGIKDYQKSTADYNFALGQNDALNGVQRSVFVLDNASYNAGKSYQNLNSSQMELDANFESQVDQGINEGKSADELWDLGAEQLRKHTEMIYNNPDIPPDVKEDLYQSNLKRQASYQKYIGNKISAKRQETYVLDRNNRAAQLSKDLTADATAPEAMAQYLSTFKENSIRQNIDIMGMKADEASNAADGEITGVIKYLASRIDPENPDAASFYDQFQQAADVAVDNGYISLANATAIRDEVLGRRKKVRDYNDTMADMQYTQKLYDISVGNTQFDPQHDTQRYVDEITSNPNISDDKKLQLIKQFTNLSEKIHTESLKSVDEMTPEGLEASGQTAQEWRAKGGTTSSYASLKAQYILKKYPNDPMGAGLALMDYTSSGEAAGDGVYLPEMAKEGGAWIANSIIPNLTASDADLANTTSGRQRVQYWEQFKQKYSVLKSRNAAAASSILDGFPDEMRSIVQATVEANGTLGDLRNNVQNAPAIEARNENFKKSVDGLTWDTVNKLGSGRLERNILSNHWGLGGNKDIDNMQIFIFKNLLKSTSNSLSLGANFGTPQELLDNAWQKGYIIPSQDGGRNHMVTPQALRVWQQLTGKGASTKDYVAKAFDNYRNDIAAKLNISKDQIFVNSDPNGKYVNFNVMNKNGTVHPAYPHGISVTQAQFGDRLRITIKDMDKRASKRDPSDVVGSVEMQGMGNYTSGKSLPFTRAATDIFNGNVGFTRQLLNQFDQYEGFVTRIQTSQSTKGQRSVPIIGHGINLQAHGKNVSPNGQTWLARAKAAEGNPAKIMAMESDFMKVYYSDLKDVPRELGFPPITAAAYSQSKAESIKFVADMQWIGNKKGRRQAIEMLNAANVTEALRLYDQGVVQHGRTKNGGEHRRVAFHKKAIRDHFKYNR